jgi:hypothetical protein
LINRRQEASEKKSFIEDRNTKAFSIFEEFHPEVNQNYREPNKSLLSMLYQFIRGIKESFLHEYLEWVLLGFEDNLNMIVRALKDIHIY